MVPAWFFWIFICIETSNEMLIDCCVDTLLYCTGIIMYIFPSHVDGTHKIQFCWENMPIIKRETLCACVWPILSRFLCLVVSQRFCSFSKLWEASHLRRKRHITFTLGLDTRAKQELVVVVYNKRSVAVWLPCVSRSRLYGTYVKHSPLNSRGLTKAH
jgi:hypothetical protein